MVTLMSSPVSLLGHIPSLFIALGPPVVLLGKWGVTTLLPCAAYGAAAVAFAGIGAGVRLGADQHIREHGMHDDEKMYVTAIHLSSTAASIFCMFQAIHHLKGKGTHRRSVLRKLPENLLSIGLSVTVPMINIQPILSRQKRLADWLSLGVFRKVITGTPLNHCTGNDRFFTEQGLYTFILGATTLTRREITFLRDALIPISSQEDVLYFKTCANMLVASQQLKSSIANHRPTNYRELYAALTHDQPQGQHYNGIARVLENGSIFWSSPLVENLNGRLLGMNQVLQRMYASQLPNFAEDIKFLIETYLVKSSLRKPMRLGKLPQTAGGQLRFWLNFNQTYLAPNKQALCAVTNVHNIDQARKNFQNALFIAVYKLTEHLKSLPPSQNMTRT